MADRGRGHGQRGGRGADQGRGASSQDGTPNVRICYDFQRGNCKRTNCKFSHVARDSAERRTVLPRPTTQAEAEEQREARKSYNAWKHLLACEPTDSSIAKRLWKGALKILESGDRECQQHLARDLDSDDKNYKGRHHIAAVMSQRVQNGDSERFIKNSERFLLIVTHPSFVDCLAVDTFIGSIYNFISGANGTRAVAFFQHLCETVVAAQTDSNTSNTPLGRLESALDAMSLALRELLKREPRARFNDGLEELLDTLNAAAKIFAPERPTICSAHVAHHVRCMRDMVARANGQLAKTLADDGAAPAPSSRYPHDLVIPNERHDNDKLDITEIVIFPTRDEIVSEAQEFLPFTDLEQPHFLEDPAQRHIDTHFRLYRHDIFSELKETLAGLMHVFDKDKSAIANPRLHTGDMRAYKYDAARIRDVVFDRALEVHMGFLPPLTIRSRTRGTQMEWWEGSNRLANGSLLSFIWIESDQVQHVFLTLERGRFASRNHVKYDGDGMVAVTARLVTQDKLTLDTLMHAYARGAQGVLLEFPGIIPGTFGPILENLQEIQSLGSLLFQRYILPQLRGGVHGSGTYHDVPPPLYARGSGFTFPLGAITKGTEDFSFPATSTSEDDGLLKQVQAKTSLDLGQSRALVAALTREFAFIQGPPGTGKSYLGVHLMRVLLSIKKKAKLGPILVVCYTNHALDQFLEHLIDFGITKVIRVGGMSKSKKLVNHNLQHLKRMGSSTKSEKYLAAQAYKNMENHNSFANGVLDDLRQVQRRATWQGLKAYICEEFPFISCQFNEIDDEGFQNVGRHPFDIWAMTGVNVANATLPAPAPPSVEDAIRKATINVFALNHGERLVLIDHWVRQMHEAKVGELFGILDDATDTQKKLGNIHAESSRRVLQEADVIGLTTTGLASRISLLKHVASKVPICEEAGEILEPHMLSALLPTIEHCIQIGDHQQLRPSVNNFQELSMESERGKLHQLDKSQFERLSVGEAGRSSVPVAQLNVQRRMRPDISTLIRETIYDKLIDHDTTIDMPEVIGMRRNVFWWDHRCVEDGLQLEIQHAKSKSNSREVAMVHALVRHIVRQGVYKSTDIAVLTPYTGQLQKLRTAMGSDFEIVISERDEEALEEDGFEIGREVEQDDGLAPGLEKKVLTDLLRVATVDNFQGEEAQVVIISLVRSNMKRNVGFLRTNNRVNVLLSRAKHGMYLIGNSYTYSTIDMWHKVIEMLRSIDAVSSALGLCCPRHPDNVMEIRDPGDFARLSPEGGCREMCTNRRDCGHSCGSKCHSDAMHSAFHCEEACQRRHHPCGHACQKASCGEPCGDCEIRVKNVQLPCGHVANGIKCHLTQNLSEVTCNVVMTKKMPGCGHDILVRCSQDVTAEEFCCTTACKKALPCGHICPGSCGTCIQNGGKAAGKPVVTHLGCIAKCGRKMGTCHHICDRKCHAGTNCGQCNKVCDVRCKHNRCPKICQQPCAPCIRPCEWACEHQGSCSLPCSAACDRLPCDLRCTNVLRCGHQCASICGERCAEYFCQQCGLKSDSYPDLLEFKPYSEIDLNKSPIIALECGHFFTLHTLDGHVSLSEVYEQDPETGKYHALLDNAQLAVKMPQCPTCRVPIRQYATQRYNRLVNKAVIDDMTKRLIVSGQSDLQKLEINFKQLSDNLEKSRQAVIPNITIPVGDPRGSMRRLESVKYFVNNALVERYVDGHQLERHIEVFQKKMANSSQPASKLYQATMSASVKTCSIDDDFANLNLQPSVPVVQPRVDLRIEQGGRMFQIKIQCLMLEDKLEINRLVKAKFSVNVIAPQILGGHLISQASTYLSSCISVIEACNSGNLPKLAVEATLYHSRIARALASFGMAKDEDRKVIEGHRQTAKDLLDRAANLCELPSKGSKDLAEAVSKSLKLLDKDFHAEVTKEEIEAIKRAMVSGPGGIATHSGHWYNCVNGHPFAIGECGMPMEQARCPECGEAVGGQRHRAVEGVTRARNMET